jgi:hypothetical protein
LSIASLYEAAEPPPTKPGHNGFWVLNAGEVMRIIGTMVGLVLAGVLPVLADELPSRKAGLWDVRMSFENRNGAGLTVRQCIDASTDQMMLSSAGPLARAACSRRDVQKSHDSVTIDSTCTLAGETATSHAVITGSFDNAYTMTVTSQSGALPGGKMAMTVVAKWLGPCAADQKPGDLIMGNGMKMNILDMQKRAPSEGVPLPP